MLWVGHVGIVSCKENTIFSKCGYPKIQNRLQNYQRALVCGIAGRAWACPWVVVGKAKLVLEEGVGHNLLEPPCTGLGP